MPGPPPKPVEVKRRTGNPGKRRLPPVRGVVRLPMTTEVPDCPRDLSDDARALWGRAWEYARAWLAPSDRGALVEACRLLDDVAVARARYRETSDPADGRVVVALSRRFAEMLSVLGFDPASRTRLGVAEVVASAGTLARLRGTR